MKVYIGVGHGGSDPGAIGRVKEADANLTIALELKKILESYGVTVGISRTKDENDKLAEEIQEANAFKPDIAVEVHNNAGGGDGFEVYVQTNGYKAKSKELAQAIEKQVKVIGQNSRGIKTKLNNAGADWFGWLREVKAPAVLLEGFFVDSKDALDFDTLTEQMKLAAAYAQGIVNYLGVRRPAASVSSKGYQADIAAGTQIYTEAGKVEKTCLYTITEEKDGMGKLKSGAGWVSLSKIKKLEG